MATVIWMQPNALSWRFLSNLESGITMEDESKIRRLAELVVQKHGRNARAILRERIEGRLRVRDYHLVALWALVAEATESILPHARRQHRIERRAREIIAADVAIRESARGNDNVAIGAGRV